MQPQPTQLVVPSDGILVLSGYGIDIRVERGRLKVSDGTGQTRRSGELHRALSRLKRLVVIGHTGSISLDAVAWIQATGASYVQLSADGEVLASFHPGTHEQPRLRRAQARALGTAAGLELAKWLVAEKLAGQLRTLEVLRRTRDETVTASAEIERSVAGVPNAVDGKHLLWLEGMAASAYWSAWSEVRVAFALADRKKVPEHWLTFGSRVSPLTRGPRQAINPANALLNYLYAILESEATIAARVMGLDPGLGVYHVDDQFRDSLAADLMEPVRPEVDRCALDLLTNRSFSAKDFFETQQGSCRITPPLAKELIATSRHWGQLVGRVAEEIAHRLIEPPRSEPLPRPFTQPGHRPTPRSSTGPNAELVARRCIVCGEPARRGSKTCGQPCLEQIRVVTATEAARKGQAMLGQLRSSGADPMRTPAAVNRLAQRISQRRMEEQAWGVQHPERPDADVYRREIFPKVAACSLPHLQRATGLSLSHLWSIRRGEAIPHQRWWLTFAALQPDSNAQARTARRELVDPPSPVTKPLPRKPGTHSGSAETRGEKQARRHAERRQWERGNAGPHDEERYWREVYPTVTARSPLELRRLTGLSVSQVKEVRAGRKVPHPRWWDMLAPGSS